MNGTYMLTHKVMSGEEQIGETLTAADVRNTPLAISIRQGFGKSKNTRLRKGKRVWYNCPALMKGDWCRLDSER